MKSCRSVLVLILVLLVIPSVSTTAFCKTSQISETIRSNDRSITLKTAVIDDERIEINFLIQNTGTSDIKVSSFLSFRSENAAGQNLTNDSFSCSGTTIDGTILPLSELTGLVCFKIQEPGPYKVFYQPGWGPSADDMVWQIDSTVSGANLETATGGSTMTQVNQDETLVAVEIREDNSLSNQSAAGKSASNSIFDKLIQPNPTLPPSQTEGIQIEKSDSEPAISNYFIEEIDKQLLLSLVPTIFPTVAIDQNNWGQNDFQQDKGEGIIFEGKAENENYHLGIKTQSPLKQITYLIRAVTAESSLLHDFHLHVDITKGEMLPENNRGRCYLSYSNLYPDRTNLDNYQRLVIEPGFDIYTGNSANPSSSQYQDWFSLQSYGQIGTEDSIDIIRVNGVANIYFNQVFIGEVNDNAIEDVSLNIGTMLGEAGQTVDCSFKNFQVRIRDGLQTPPGDTSPVSLISEPGNQPVENQPIQLEQIESLFPTIILDRNNSGLENLQTNLGDGKNYTTLFKNGIYHTIFSSPVPLTEGFSYGEYFRQNTASISDFAFHADVALSEVLPAGSTGNCVLAYTNGKTIQDELYRSVHLFLGDESFGYSQDNGGAYQEGSDLSAFGEIGRNYSIDIIRMNGTASIFIDGVLVEEIWDEMEGNINWWFGSYTGSGGTYTDCAFNNFEIRTTQNIQAIQSPIQNPSPQVNPEKQNLLNQVQSLFPNVAVNPYNWGIKEIEKNASEGIIYRSKLENGTFHAILDAPEGAMEENSYGLYLSTQLGSFHNFALHTDVTITQVQPSEGYGDCYVSYTDKEIVGENRFKWFDVELGYLIRYAHPEGESVEFIDLSNYGEVGRTYSIDIIRIDGTANVFIDGVFIGEVEDGITSHVTMFLGTYIEKNTQYVDCAFSNFEIRVNKSAGSY